MSEQLRTGLWLKNSERGHYWNGTIQVGGQEYWLNLYPNDRKQHANHPDMNLVLKPKEPKQEESQQDLPF